jgi:hypothetical protein
MLDSGLECGNWVRRVKGGTGGLGRGLQKILKGDPGQRMAT